jgi:hypothetical protein
MELLLCGLPLEVMATPPLLPLLPLGLRLKGDILSDRRAGWGSISNNIVRRGGGGRGGCYVTKHSTTRVLHTLHCSTNTENVYNPLTH